MIGACGCSGAVDNIYEPGNYDGGTTIINHTIIIQADAGAAVGVTRTVYCTATLTPSYTGTEVAVDDAGVAASTSPLNLTYTETDFNTGLVSMSGSVAGIQQGPYGSPSYLPLGCDTVTGGTVANECQSATFLAGPASPSPQQANNQSSWTDSSTTPPAITLLFKVYPVASELVVNVNTLAPSSLPTPATPSSGFFFYDQGGVSHAGTYQAPGVWTLGVDRKFTTFTAMYQDPDLSGGHQVFTFPISSCLVSVVDGG
jgi:hypothetical protein